MKRRKVRDEAVDWRRAWEIGWWRREFRRVRQEPAFHGIVTLARLGNVLRFVQTIVASLAKEDSPARRRQMINFYLNGAVLVEGSQTVGRVGRHFRTSARFRETVAAVVHSRSYRDVVERFRELRNRSAFHFDEEAAADGLARIEPDFVTFVSGKGKHDMGTHYDLADIVAFALITRDDPPDPEWSKRWLDRSAEASNALMSAIDRFVVAEIAERKAVRRQRPS